MYCHRKPIFPHASSIKMDAQLAQQLREHGIIVRYFNKPRINQFYVSQLVPMNKTSVWSNTLKNQIF